MSQEKEQIALFGNHRRECKAVALGAGVSCTFHFRASGSDSGTAKYYDLNQPARKVAILLSVAASITHTNGKAYTAPVPLAVGWNTFSDNGFEWEKITIKADAATNVTVLAY